MLQSILANIHISDDPDAMTTLRDVNLALRAVVDLLSLCEKANIRW